MSILKQSSSKQKDITDLSGLDLLKLANSIFDKISNLKDGYNLSDLINEFPILRSTLDSYKEDHPDKSDVEMIFLLLRKAEKKDTNGVTTTIVTDQEGYQYLRFNYSNKWFKKTFHWVKGWMDDYYVIVRSDKQDQHVFIKPTGEIRIIRKDK